MEITRGKINRPKKIVIYGPEGIGKSTFAAAFPDPVFIDTEESTKEMDVRRLPAPSSWQMIKDEVRYVIGNPDCCRTLVLDTADWAENFCIGMLNKKHNTENILTLDYGRGSLYVSAEFGELLNLLTEVTEKGVNVVLTAHAAMRKQELPDEMGTFDRWELKLQSKQVKSMVKEWADAVFFANYKTHTVATDKDGKKKKAIGAGRRVMYTTHHSCWDAKNRYGMPDELDFNYDEIREIIEDSDLTPPKKEPVKKKTAAKPDPAPAEPVKEPENEIPEEHEEEPVTSTFPPESRKSDLPDPRIPKALRDLMIENNVHEWDIQDIVQSKGYLPSDIPIWEYDEKAGEGFIEGVLVGAWPQVMDAIKEMWEKGEIPFN